MRHIIPLAFLSLILLLPGCGYGKGACQVIDVTKDVCAVVRYMGPDGKVVEESVDGADLRVAVQATRARRGGP